MATLTRQQLTALLIIDPGRVRAEILRAFKRARAHREEAARLLGCGRVTFIRWVERLGMEKELARLEEQAKAEGWHHGRVGGWPRGRKRGPRAAAKRAARKT